MGGLAEAQLASAVEALATRDSDLAERVVGNQDEAIDEIETEINARAHAAVDLACAGGRLQICAKSSAR